MKKFYLSAIVLTCLGANAQIVDVSVYNDCSKNGYSMGIAKVLNTAGRTSCEWVQLWENGPKWATFNVGATITDYAQLTVGADATSYNNYTDQAPSYNTANVGGVYAWNNPNLNGRKTTWTSSVSTGISDVATTLWGSNWETPTRAQLDTLQNSDYGKTTWTWCDGSTTQYVAGCTLKGYKVSGVGDYVSYSIFLPAAGYFRHDHGKVFDASYYGDYWPSIEYNSNNAYNLHFDSSNRYVGYDLRKIGMSVRAVLSDNAEIQESLDIVTLTLNANGCEDSNVITCPSGQQIRFTAVDTTHSHFVQWSDGNADNPRTIIVTQDTTFTAEFAINQYTVSISSDNPSAGIVSGNGTYDALTNVTVMAAASAVGYKWDKWSDGVTLAGRQIILTSDTTLTAYFVSADEVECIEVEENNALLGTADIQIIATPNKGAQFTQWSDGHTDNPRIVTNAPGLYTAIFSESATKTNSIPADQQNAIQKRIVDDQLIIQRDGKTYNAQGGEL